MRHLLLCQPDKADTVLKTNQYVDSIALFPWDTISMLRKLLFAMCTSAVNENCFHNISGLSLCYFYSEDAQACSMLKIGMVHCLVSLATALVCIFVNLDALCDMSAEENSVPISVNDVSMEDSRGKNTNTSVPMLRAKPQWPGV